MIRDVKKGMPIIVIMFTLVCMMGGCGGINSSISDTLKQVVKSDSYKTVYQLRNEYVRLEGQGTCRGFTVKPNDHPAHLSPENLQNAMSSLMVLPPDLEFPIPVFTAEKINMLVEPIIKAIGSSSPGEDVLIAVTGDHQRSFGKIRSMTTVRMFMANGELNFIFGTVHARVDEIDPRTNTEPTYYRPDQFKQGTRCEPSKTKFKFMVSRPGVRFYTRDDGMQRSDWIIVDVGIKSERGKQMVPDSTTGRVEPTTPASDSQPQRPLIYHREIKQAPSTVASSGIEERLEILKRLKDKGLITADDYNDKKKKLLEEF